ncbi:MAG: YhbY family RNA-binding protein [Acidilobaceae archaeon]
MRLKERLREAIHGRADVSIGKGGASESVLREIEARLKVKSVVKVRVLRSGLEASGSDRRSLASEIAEKLGAKLVEVRGKTFILYKPKRRGSTSQALG